MKTSLSGFDKPVHHAPRLDSPVQMILDYQEQIGSLIELQDQLRDINAYNLDMIFEIAWPHLNYIIPDLSGGLVMGLLDGKLNKYAQKNNFEHMKSWENISGASKQSIVSALKKDDMRSVILWNYEDDAPLFVSDFSENQAVEIVWLCEKPDDESLYIALIRNVKRRPFLCHEVQALKLAGGIIGSRANFAFTYDALIGGISKKIRDKEFNKRLA